jgi:hypothetical protein
LPEVKDDDYDTKPLPDNDGDPQRELIISFIFHPKPFTGIQ